jgi:hypothetical protein
VCRNHSGSSRSCASRNRLASGIRMFVPTSLPTGLTQQRVSGNHGSSTAVPRCWLQTLKRRRSTLLGWLCQRHAHDCCHQLRRSVVRHGPNGPTQSLATRAASEGGGRRPGGTGVRGGRRPRSTFLALSRIELRSHWAAGRWESGNRGCTFTPSTDSWLSDRAGLQRRMSRMDSDPARASPTPTEVGWALHF